MDRVFNYTSRPQLININADMFHVFWQELCCIICGKWIPYVGYFRSCRAEEFKQKYIGSRFSCWLLNIQLWQIQSQLHCRLYIFIRTIHLFKYCRKYIFDTWKKYNIGLKMLNNQINMLHVPCELCERIRECNLSTAGICRLIFTGCRHRSSCYHTYRKGTAEPPRIV